MIEQIRSLLSEQLAPEHLEAKGDGSHFQVIVVSEKFAQLRAIKRQQMVYAVLNEHIASGDIHALSIKTYTPQEWVQAQKFGI